MYATIPTANESRNSASVIGPLGTAEPARSRMFRRRNAATAAGTRATVSSSGGSRSARRPWIARRSARDRFRLRSRPLNDSHPHLPGFRRHDRAQRRNGGPEEG